MTYEIYSTHGRLLGTTDSLFDAGYKLARWHQAEFVIRNGREIALVKEDSESRHRAAGDDDLIPCSMSEVA